MKLIACPYCETLLETAEPDKFHPCPSCGYSSARVASGPNGYLIIDSQLPDLMGRYEELQKRQEGHVVVIDRRVMHNPIAGTDRRR